MKMDAYCKREGNSFLMGTEKVEKSAECMGPGTWMMEAFWQPPQEQ